MSISMSTSLRNARLQVIVDAIDAGSGPGMIRFYGDTRPATGVAITTETLIAENVLSDPMGTVANAVLTFAEVNADVDADAAETITWARIVDSDDNFVIDADCGLSGSGADFIFNVTTIELSGVVKVISASITEGGV